jgi:hypothetical protein
MEVLMVIYIYLIKKHHYISDKQNRFASMLRFSRFRFLSPADSFRHSAKRLLEKTFGNQPKGDQHHLLNP